MNRFSICLLAALFVAFSTAFRVDPPVWLQVKAQSGDDVPTLLDRFGLYDHACNISQFFKINKLPEDYRLKAGASYSLPIQLVRYNGKSIRTTLNIADWRTAKDIETYNKAMREQGVRADDFIASKNLWVPWHLLNCPEQTRVSGGEPPRDPPPSKASLAGAEVVKGTRVFPIFGKKYEKTPLKSRKLLGQVFYIVSGHGGPDVGAEGKRAGRTLCEDEYAYDVSLRLARLLLSHGATTYIIVRDPNDGIRDDAFLLCDKDEEVWGNQTIPYDQKERLQQRCDIINDLTLRHQRGGAATQTLVEIHVDSRSRDKKTDVFFYYRPESEPSFDLATHIHRTFLQKYLKVRGQRRYDGTVTPRGLYMLLNTTTPRAVYIELGNIRNDWDQQRLVLASNRQALANWLCEALLTGK